MTAKPERPSLASLPLKKKGSPFVTGDAEARPEAPRTDESKADGKVPVMVRMMPADRKLIRQIAIGMDTSVQRLLEEAITDIIRRHRGALNL